MTVEHSTEYLQSLVSELLRMPNETEWVELKLNNADVPMIGEYISALANSAALLGKPFAYMLWGVDDETHEVSGTTFSPSVARYKQQELESWLLQKLSPKIHFSFYEFERNDRPMVLLEIQASSHTPVQFDGVEYVRVGSYKKKMKDFSEKERGLWRVFDKVPFERQMAVQHISADEVFSLLDYPTYFDMTGLPLPEERNGILTRLEDDFIIVRSDGGIWNITNLGAILFAKKLQRFRHLQRKAVRVILYRGNSRVETIREMEGNKGYAIGFEGLIETIKTVLPENEMIGQALRKTVPMYPELAIRELVANAIIHQDFSITGTGPMIEIFDGRMEITNPGTPLMETERFLDTPPRSRNEAIASFLRRVGICEERGSGVDKVVTQTEFFQLPAPLFESLDTHTRATLFSHKELKEMDKSDRIRAVYLHSCLKYVNKEDMNNATIRERFGIEEQNKAQASRIIAQALGAELIRPYDPTAGVRKRRYLPFWA